MSDGDDLGGRLRVLLHEIVAPERWGVRTESFWCYVEPPGHSWRLQGWKLHVSATAESAPTVLENAARVLLGRRACFKFAKGLDQVAELTSMRYPRSGGAKFITVYPDNDQHFRLLAEELHRATSGLAGPAILSDRAYQPGSLVHYRYGGFTSALPRLDDDGSYVPMLVAPDGTWVEDRREAWFTAPPWAPPPLPAMVPPTPPAERGRPVLIADRYQVDEAIRHSNRGGVYRAVDRTSGRRVILKEARPHIADAHTWLRREADMLDLLEPLGVTPRKVALTGYQGHLFLAEEEIPGPSLRRWVEERSRDEESRRPPLPDVLAVARRLVDLVALVHGAGLVLRDFNPGNVVVTPGGTLRLVDVEFVTRPGERAAPVMTPGYTAPEQIAAGSGPASQAADLYSLGACLLYICSGVNPVLAAEDAPARPVEERMELLVRTAMHGNEALRRLAPAVLGLTAGEPEARWSLQRVEAALRNGSRRPPGPTPITVLTSDEQDDLLRDLLAHTVERMTPDAAHLWPPFTYENRTGDPGNVHTGAGGIVAVLTGAVRALDDERCRDALATAATWLAAELEREPRALPGLFFGRSGAAWALHQAARTLEHDELAERALSYAKRIPLRWPVPDFTHGTAGAGVAQLALWRATGDAEFRARAQYCADSLMETRRHQVDEVVWPIPDEFGSKLAGLTHYGFAHGVAGIATFLLAAGRDLARPDYTDLAVTCGDALYIRAEPVGEAVRWPVGPKDSASGGAPAPDTAWWCNGSGGIGAFFARLWRATGEARFLHMAEMAATAVRNERWLVGPGHCHGNAGNGELLLDLAAVRGDARYLTWAAELAACVRGGHVRTNRRTVIPTPDESFGYNLGLAGIIGFLLRLRHGGPRWFMPDDFTLQLPPTERR
ncbi:class IV lanthionine synthetase LanL [Nonomuraea guangzhouensis]|uniref:Class IV lanthionine synthetase LanL n=1 Tax=Nonomuraea guangzhouensis TaxID=1291555 RepID=A0ABW4FY39_9ACTN|nr:class IV lanthionine synthetase LanL [Nonomuraea guangzhouensis]